MQGALSVTSDDSQDAQTALGRVAGRWPELHAPGRAAVALSARARLEHINQPPIRPWPVGTSRGSQPHAWRCRP